MIQWYPGHMAKAFREIDEKIKFVDCILVLLDARIPRSSFNPDIIKRCQNKKIIFCLTKIDLADSNKTNQWINYYKKQGYVVGINSKENKSRMILSKAIKDALKEKIEKDRLKGINKKSIKVMVLGIPNVGKSTLINMLANKKVASIGNKPGVTKSQQWIKINDDFELLDTPGVLWPKFENDEVGFNLALIGSIKDNILPILDICNYGVKLINDKYPNMLEKRYLVKYSENYIETLSKEKKFYTNGELDINKGCMTFLNDLRIGSLGRITLEEVEYE